MNLGPAWTLLLDEAKAARRGRIAAYSEFMPPPYVVVKPSGAVDPLALPDDDQDIWRISEYEQAQELRPGLLRIARHILEDLASLARGRSHRLSRALVDDNPAWPAALAGARVAVGRHADAGAAAGAVAHAGRQGARALDAVGRQPRGSAWFLAQLPPAGRGRRCARRVGALRATDDVGDGAAVAGGGARAGARRRRALPRRGSAGLHQRLSVGRR